MIYEEVKRDLFTVSEEYNLAHCISSDFVMSAGIAVPFNNRFNLKKQFNQIKKRNPTLLEHPTCIRIGRVLNLITKKNVWEKPTYDTMTSALKKMKKICIEKGIGKIAMPKIGCGIDKLEWSNIREIIKEIFTNSDIEILVCYID